jgi:hypothetical protein
MAGEWFDLGHPAVSIGMRGRRCAEVDSTVVIDRSAREAHVERSRGNGRAHDGCSAGSLRSRRIRPRLETDALSLTYEARMEEGLAAETG